MSESLLYLQEGGIKTNFHTEKTQKNQIQPTSPSVRIFFKAVWKFSFWTLNSTKGEFATSVEDL